MMGFCGRMQEMHDVRLSTSNRPRSRPGMQTVLATGRTVGLPAAPAAGARDWEKLPDMPVEKWEPGAVVLDGMWVAAAP